MTYGLVGSGHGSRDLDAVAEFGTLVNQVKARTRMPVTHGFLEFASSTIDSALRTHLDRGLGQGVRVPGVLLAATHAKNDTPAAAQTLPKQYPDRDLRMASVLGRHPRLLQLCERQLNAAEAQSKTTVWHPETCLVVVGRGTRDPDANGEVCKIARLLAGSA